MRQIRVADLRPGVVIRHGHENRKRLHVRSLTRGASCNGFHVNENRSNDGMLLSSDGCYDRAAYVNVENDEQ